MLINSLGKEMSILSLCLRCVLLMPLINICCLLTGENTISMGHVRAFIGSFASSRSTT